MENRAFFGKKMLITRLFLKKKTLIVLVLHRICHELELRQNENDPVKKIISFN